MIPRILDPEIDRAEIEANRAAVIEDIPEMLPFLKALVAEGAIDGWRNVVEVGPGEPFQDGKGWVDVRKMESSESMQDIAERMRRDQARRR